jgi:hypothetical protein
MPTVAAKFPASARGENRSIQLSNFQRLDREPRSKVQSGTPPHQNRIYKARRTQNKYATISVRLRAVVSAGVSASLRKWCVRADSRTCPTLCQVAQPRPTTARTREPRCNLQSFNASALQNLFEAMSSVAVLIRICATACETCSWQCRPWHRLVSSSCASLRLAPGAHCSSHSPQCLRPTQCPMSCKQPTAQ